MGTWTGTEVISTESFAEAGKYYPTITVDGAMATLTPEGEAPFDLPLFAGGTAVLGSRTVGDITERYEFAMPDNDTLSGGVTRTEPDCSSFFVFQASRK